MKQISYLMVALPLVFIQAICCVLNIIYDLPNEFTGFTMIIVLILGMIIGMFLGLYVIEK